jgi:hypothetical protein
MFLTFSEDITKKDQDGITFVCIFKEQQEVTLKISRTALNVMEISNDDSQGIINKINNLLLNSPKLDDNEILKEIGVDSHRTVLITNLRTIKIVHGV